MILGSSRNRPSFTTHRHTPNRVKWNWATDRIEHWCSCGLKLADDWDEASYGPPLPECGQSWLIDLAFGLVVLATAFAVTLTLLLLT